METTLDSKHNISHKKKDHDSELFEEISVHDIAPEIFRSKHGEILFPVMDSAADYQEPLEYAIKMATMLEASIILVYVTPHVRIPDPYMEYALIERFPDFPASYYDEMGAQKTAPLRTRLKDARVKHKTFTFIGDLNEALGIFERNNNIVLAVIPGQINKVSLARRLFGGASFSISLSKLRLPVLIVPGKP